MKKSQEKMQKIRSKYLTDRHGMPVFSETREIAGSPSRDIEMPGKQKVPNNRDSLKWTRGGLHPFHQVLTLICYFIHHGPGSTHSLYRTMTEISKQQKEPLLQEILFVAPDEVRNVRTISVCSKYTPIYEDVKWSVYN